eukprot:3940253-Rhodomonas_salina.2
MVVPDFHAGYDVLHRSSSGGLRDRPPLVLFPPAAIKSFSPHAPYTLYRESSFRLHLRSVGPSWTSPPLSLDLGTNTCSLCTMVLTRTPALFVPLGKLWY